MSAADVDVTIRLPLPLDVAATITHLIGTAYPKAVIATGTGSPDLVMRIPAGARPRRVTKKDTTPETASDPEGTLQRVEPGRLVFGTPIDVAHAFLPLVERTLAEYDAENYVEQEIRGDNGMTYALIFARSPRQTPHALRAAADAENARLRAAVDAALSLCADGQPVPTADVKAALTVGGGAA